MNVVKIFFKLIVFLTCVSVLHAQGLKQKNSFIFKPINPDKKSYIWNKAAPWLLPDNYTQTVISNENSLNIYQNQADWPDMNTVNETGPERGRYLYRSHELGSHPDGGAISVVDLKTGESKILLQDTDYRSIDGIRWTPWGTILFGEERRNGRIFEINLDKDNLTHVDKVLERPLLGRLAHEGIEVDSKGNVYVIDERRGLSNSCQNIKPCGGGIYKFVPQHYGNLSSGKFYVLKVIGDDGVGQGEWVGPIDPIQARESGSRHGGESYQRPEDIEIINNILYVAITEGSTNFIGLENYDGRVIAINLSSLKVSNFVKPGLNVPVEKGRPDRLVFQVGLNNVDNLAEMPDGRLMLIEDNYPSDIWVASTKTDELGASIQVDLFASLTDPRAEGTGIYFSPFDPNVLYVNIQHSVEDGDGTWAIKKRD